MKRFLVILLFTAPLCAQVNFEPAVRKNLIAQRVNDDRMCDQFAGATGGARIAACIADLPSVGGVADATSMEGGTLSITTDIFAGITKPVHLKLGCASYLLSDSVSLTLPNNFRLTGLGECSKINVLTHSGNYTSADAPIFSIASKSNIVIEGVQVVGAGAAYPGMDTTWGACVLTDEVTNLTIQNSHFSNCQGLLIREAQHSKIIGNYLSGDFSQDSIQISSQNGSFRADYNVVSANTVKNVKINGIGSGIRVGDFASYNTIIGNTVIGDDSINATECIINDGDGLNTFTGNTCKGWDLGLANYSGSNNVWSSNVIESTAGSCIFVTSNATHPNANSNIIQGNECKAVGSHGIHINDGTGSPPSHNRIIGNTIYSVATANMHGITVSGSPDNSVIGNTVYTVAQYGILSDTSTGTVIQDNEVSSASDHGIYITGSTQHHIVTGNTLDGDGSGGEDGIFLDTDVINSIVAGNVIRDYDQEIIITTATGNVVGPNIAANVTTPGGDTVNEIVWPADKDLEVNGPATFLSSTAFGQPLNIGANPATDGTLRLPNEGFLAGRNAANSDNLAIIGTGSANQIRVGDDSPITLIEMLGPMTPKTVTQANLSSGTDGSMYYCSNCQVTSGADNTCASGGSGALAIRVNGVYRCFATQN